MSVQSIKEDTFENEVINSDTPVLIDFWAEWCGPCKEIAPILEEVAGELKNKIKIVKINIDENPNIPIQYGIQSIPTLIILKKGSEISRKVGGTVKSELLTWINTSI